MNAIKDFEEVMETVECVEPVSGDLDDPRNWSYEDVTHIKTGNKYSCSDVTVGKLKIDGEWRDTVMVEYYPYHTWKCEETGVTETRGNYKLRFFREFEDFKKSFELTHSNVD